jgi:hypothetical protein
MATPACYMHVARALSCGSGAGPVLRRGGGDSGRATRWPPTQVGEHGDLIGELDAGGLRFGSEQIGRRRDSEQQSNGSLMLDLDCLPGVAKSNIYLHSVLPVGCLVITVHLIPSWMNGISRLVSLSKYLILQLIDVRYTDPSFVLQYTSVIFHKSGWLHFLNIALYFLDLLIFWSTFLYILE